MLCRREDQLRENISPLNERALLGGPILAQNSLPNKYYKHLQVTMEDLHIVILAKGLLLGSPREKPSMPWLTTST